MTMFYIFWIILFAVVVAGVFISRAILVKKLNMLMHSNPTRDMVEPGLPKEAVHGKPGSPLNFVEINAKTQLKDAALVRESLIRQAENIFARKFGLDVLAALGYAFFGVIALRLVGEKAGVLSPHNAGYPIAFYLVIYSFLSLLAFSSQFRAYNSGLSRLGIFYYRIYFFATNPRYSIHFALLCILCALWLPFLDDDDPSLSAKAKWATVIAAVAAVALHVLLWFWLFNMYRKKKNYKLLVLRVFDIDDNAKFTFDGLLRYWKHFGSFLTVADPALLRNQMHVGWRLFRFGILAAALSELAISMRNTDSGRIWIFVLFALALAAYFILMLVYSLKTMERNVITSSEVLEAKLAFIERWPRRLSHTFRDEPVVCYDSTWQMAVRKFIQTSQVILMDLRGFTDARKGCKTEVKLLLQMAPLERLTFLVDEDWSNVKSLLQECWNEVGGNATLNDPSSPEVNIYVATKKNSKDIQGIMDTLLNSAVVSAQ
jgi:hypothetical protein